MDKERHRKGVLAVNVGLIANAFLAVIKTVIGIAGNSPALLADGINSTSDVVYGAVVSVFMRLSGKPADEEHPYGHHQLESIAAVVVGAFVISTAISIFWSAIHGVYELYAGVSDFTGASRLAMWVAMGTVVCKICLTFWTFGVARVTNNSAVLALAADHRNDIFAALAATVGIYLGRLGLHWVDPLAGGIVALIIFHTGVEIIRDAAADLMDSKPGLQLMREIQRVSSEIEGIEELEEVYISMFGPYIVANITVGVAPQITVAKGDQIATEIEKKLIDEIEFMRRVYVHYHPAKTKERGTAQRN